MVGTGVGLGGTEVNVDGGVGTGVGGGADVGSWAGVLIASPVVHAATNRTNSRERHRVSRRSR